MSWARDEHGRYVVPAAQAGEPGFSLDCSCGYGIDAPERMFEWITGRHAHAHNKGMDGLPAGSDWEVRHIAAEPAPEADAELEAG